MSGENNRDDKSVKNNFRPKTQAKNFQKSYSPFGTDSKKMKKAFQE